MSKPNINITIDLVLGQPSMEILHLAASASPAVTPPVNTAAPVISGEGCVGSGLSCTTGTWSNGGGTISGYSYQWYADGSPIGGATANTFTVTASELNASVTCQVVATNEYGASDPAESNAIVILVVVPSNLVAPSISGSAIVGQLLTCDPGTWNDGGGTISGYTFQWYADASPISGAVSDTYVLTESEAGAEITCTVVATNECGDSDPATSNATTPVITTPTNTVAPVISGTATEGQELSCTTGTWNVGGGTISAYIYQWYADAVAISGATNNTFTLTSTQVGAAEITCSVVATNEAGDSDPASSNALGPVLPASLQFFAPYSVDFDDDIIPLSGTGNGDAAIAGGVLDLDGTGDYVSYAANAAFVWGELEEKTIDFHVYLDAASGASFVKGLVCSGAFGIGAGFGIGHYLGNVFVRIGGAAGWSGAGAGLTTGAWHHVAITRTFPGSVSTYKAYIDGTEVLTQASTQYLVTQTALHVGNVQPIDANRYSDCKIANLRFSDTALWTSNFTPPAAPS